MNLKGPERADGDLLRLFLGGDESAFRELVARHERPLYNFILRSVRDQEAARDLTQEVFLRVLQRGGEFRGDSRVSTWLYTIARNLVVDHSRRMSHRRHLSLEARPMRDGRDGDGPTLGDRAPSHEPSSERQIAARDVRERVAAAVEVLPVEQRDVFLLRQLEGLPFKEIAEIVGVPENTVKSRMRYALERLQEALAEYEEYAHEVVT